MNLRFAKYHGLGNDFVVVEGPLMDEERARRVCDRHRGVGADGVLTILPARSTGAAAAMHVYNPDGSVAEMCGNGIRCVARELVRRGVVRGRGDVAMIVDTGAGPRRCVAHLGPGGEADEVTVEMGPARLLGEEVFTVGGERLVTTRVSMGNPHAVLLDERPTRERAATVGPAIERAVPGGANVGFARPGPDGIDLVVWERGAGLTEACGTGACAAAVAAASRGLVARGRPVEVRLPGGPLRITVSEDLASVAMRGPASLVFSGEADL